MNRRDVLKWLVHGVASAVMCMIALPSVVTGLSPIWKRRPETRWRPIGVAEAYPVGAVREVVVDSSQQSWPPAVARRSVYVWRRTAEEFVVFSRSCTDLGCPVHYDAGSQCYLCPCHGGIFDKDGRQMAGPPERPLDRYDARVREGQLEIDLASVPPMA